MSSHVPDQCGLTAAFLHGSPAGMWTPSSMDPGLSLLRTSLRCLGSLFLEKNPAVGWTPQHCNIYLQELDQVLTVNIREKIPLMLPARGGDKEAFSKYIRALCS